MPTLTPKQRRFCQEYLLDGCGTAAARRAGYAQKAAAQQATRLLKRAHVKAYLEKLNAKIEAGIQAKCEMSAQWVIEQLGSLVERANDTGQLLVAHRCLETLAKHYGVINDSGERNRPGSPAANGAGDEHRSPASPILALAEALDRETA